MDLNELFPNDIEPNRGPGISYCVAANARMFDYELVMPGERRMCGCLRAVNKTDAERILRNRHPNATTIEIGKSFKIITPSKKA